VGEGVTWAIWTGVGEGVAAAPGVGLGVGEGVGEGEAVGDGDGEGEGEGEGEGLGDGLGVGVARILKANLHWGAGVLSTALGVAWGTVGATGFSWRSLITVKIAKPAKKRVAKIIKIIAQFFFKFSIFLPPA
jgi:hypothetical protein